MENFNGQFANHPQIELLKNFFLEHGTCVKMKKKERFSTQGEINNKGAYIEEGQFRYTCIDKRGNEHIVGYSFSGEFSGSLDSFINPTQPSLVTIEAVRDSKIYYIHFAEIEKFFSMNFETMQTRCFLAEQSYSVIYGRLLDFYCKNTEELYLDLLNRCPDIQEYVTLKEIASFLQVTPETISHIRRRLGK